MFDEIYFELNRSFFEVVGLKYADDPNWLQDIYLLNNEVASWLKENCYDEYFCSAPCCIYKKNERDPIQVTGLIRFNTKESAMAFKLRWL